MENFVGQSIKGYELKERIAAGGFGVVYRAYQSTVGREVAIKVILPGLANQPDFIRRFEAEAQLIARLEHMNIVPLYDYWRDPDGAYLVMRYLRGGSLHDSIIQNGALSIEDTVNLFTQIAQGLHVAHRSQVIHRDIKPGNILLDEDGNAYLADFGIAKDHTTTRNITEPDSFIGSPEYLAPEQARSETVTPQTDIYSLGVVLYEMLSGGHPFPNLEKIETIFKHLNEPLPEITTLDDALANDINAVIQKATTKNPAQRFGDVLEMLEALRQAAKLDAIVTPASLVELLTPREQEVMQLIIDGKSNREIADILVLEKATVKSYIKSIYRKLNVRSRVQAIARARDLNFVIQKPKTASSLNTGHLPEPENPYKGLRAFQAADAQDYYGREKLTRKLLNRLQQKEIGHRFLALIGPSGSGKSSLARAGLIPSLWRGDLPGSEKWYIVDMLPGSRPLDELEVALLRVAGDHSLNLREQLERDTHGLLRAANLILPDEDSELLLVIDQFEEVFTLLEDETERLYFLNLIQAAVLDKRSRVRIVITLRADYYDRPLQYPDFGELMRNRVETVLPLSAEELERAINEPAHHVGVQFEEGLVSRIVGDVHYEPGALPLLQYALTELFEQRDGRVLTHEAYQQIGGAVGALAKRADMLFQEMDETYQGLTGQMFLRLVTLGEGTGDTRRRVNRSELLAISTPPEIMEEIIDVFAEYRLLSLDHDPATRSPTVEVAHEAILGQWDRLRQWININREEIKMQQQLSRMAEEWLNAEQDTSYLATGMRLEQMQNWASSSEISLTSDEREFLEASIVERNQRRQLEESRKERESALEQRAVQRLRWLVATLSIAMIGAIILSGFAFVQGNQADKARLTAVAAQGEALTQANIANSLLLSNQAETIYTDQDMPLGLALSLVANQLVDIPPVNAQAVLANLAYAPGPQRRFTGHEHSVNEVDFSPDGQFAISASDDQTLMLWDVSSGEILRTFTGHTDRVMGVAFLPDGQTVVSSSKDGTVNLWDVTSGEVLHTFEVSGYGMIVSPNGQYLVTPSDESWIMWDIETRSRVETNILESPLAFSADSQFLATSSGGEGSEESIVIWDIATGESVKLIQTPISLSAFTFSPDAKYIAAGGAQPLGGDHIVQVWNVTSGALVHEFTGHTEWIWDVTFSPDSKTIASASLDGTIRLWDVDSGNLISVFRGHGDEVNSIDFSPDGQSLISASGDKSIMLWDLQNHNTYLTIEGFLRPVEDVAYHPDGQMLASASFRDITLWNIETGEAVTTLSGHMDTVNALAFTPDGQSLVSASNDRKLHLWDIASEAIVHTFEGHQGSVLSIAISDDGQVLASGSADKNIILWDISSGEALQTFEGHKRDVFSVDFAPDGQRLVSSSFREIIVWDVTSGEALLTLEGHNSDVKTVAFSPDGSMIASGSKDRTIIVWDAVSGDMLSVFADFDDEVNTITFSPDGSHLVIGLGDGTISVLDVNWNTILRQFTEHNNSVLGMSLSSDGRFIASASADRTVKIWRLDSLEQLIQWTRANRYISELDCDDRLQYRIEPLCDEVEA